MNLFRIAVRRPVATAMLFIGIVVLGLYSFLQLPVEFFPDLDSPSLSVVTTYPGAGATEVERNVTDPLEERLSTVPNLDEMTSNSIDNASTITLSFEWGTDMSEASNDVRDAIDRAARALPTGADDPIVQKFDAGAIPVVIYSATANESYFELEQLIEDELARPLNRISGVGAVSVTGAPQKQIDITVDPQRFDAHNLTMPQVAQALAEENVLLPAGRLDLGPDSYNLRINTEFTSLDDIGAVIVANRNGRTIRLREVATIEEGFEDETAIARTNGRRGVTIAVQKQTGANTVQVSSDVRDRLPALIAGLPADVEVEMIIDTSEFIVGSINNLSSVLFFALVFVVLIVLIFLRRWRATFIVASTIPVSLIVAFMYLAFTGGSLNIISLSSLSIALGMVVDDAIVVLENIMRQVESGSRPKEAAIYGTGEVGLAVVATTLAVAAVFLPLTFLTGMTGVWFAEIGFIVTVTVVTSTLAALTLTPMMASLLLRRLDDGQAPPKWLQMITSNIESGFGATEQRYGRGLRWALTYRKTVLAGAGVLFVGSLLLVPTIGTEFMPVSDNSQIQISGELETSRSLLYTANVVERLEESIKSEVPELLIISSTSGGTGGMGGGVGSSNQFQVRLGLVGPGERDRSVFDIADQVRGLMDEMPELVNYSASAGSGAGGAGQDPVQVRILGQDLDATTVVADRLAAHMEGIDGVRDVSLSRGPNRPELEFAFDRDRLSDLGLTSSSVASAVRGNLVGQTATSFRSEGQELDVVLRHDPATRASLSQIEAMTVRTPGGRYVRVGDLGDVREFQAPPNIERIDRDRVVTVSAGLHGRPLNQVMDEVRAWMDRQDLPPQLEIIYGGDIEAQQEAFSDLFLVLLLSIVLVYLVMAAQFESLKEPFVIMFSIPFAFTGVLLALLLTNTPLSVMSFLGGVILVGIVVKNAIVLVDYVKLLQGRGIGPVEAIVQGGIARLRPVLMTTLTTVLALFPLALGLGEGGEIWQPMAISVIGGLLLSTVVTLVLVPVIYGLFERKRLGDPTRGGMLAPGTPRLQSSAPDRS